MVKTLKPYGAISDELPRYKYEFNGKHYIIDKGKNKYQVEKIVYDNLNIPLWNIND